MALSPTKIVCVGRNYAAHAAELGNEVPAEPLIFLKPPSAVIRDGEPIVLPAGAGRIEFEGEIGVVVGRRASKIAEEDAWSYVQAVVPVNDVTARELQKTDGQWTRAKGFDTFCPVGEAVPVAGVDVDALSVVTRVNGEVRQEGSVAQMAYSIPRILAHITAIMTLEPGDIVSTGTPEGVGPLVEGDVVEVEVRGVGKVRNPVRAG
jgi:2-keto-4-pentenoate hydratase/2-oxohepta-3-ene-1,7-dioic acid hydratase in catechol pathway